MLRRQFLGSLAGVACPPPPFPARDLEQQIRRRLFEAYLPFDQRYIVDHQLGGFCCHADRDGRRLSGEKVTWYQGRGVWVYSYLYNHFGRDQRWLDTAARAVRFLERTRPANPGAMRPLKYDRQGTPITPPDPEVYSDMFVAEGLAEFANATGERRYFDEARRLLLHCERAADSPGYAPRAGVACLGPAAPSMPGARIVGVWMVLLRQATQMLRHHREDGELARVARRATDAILGPHYNPAWGLNREILTHDFGVPANAYGPQSHLGHSMEALWMVMDEALRRQDQALFDTAAGRFRRHVEVARDRVYGGVLENLIDVERNVWGPEKSLWCHLEVLLGALLLVERRRDPWAAELFTDLWAHLEEKWCLKRRGLPLYIFNTDRRVTFQRHSTRIENYHLPRFLMLASLALGRIARS
jgi:mannose/cellobiose epimerase-like protein (N-acyl-D-glucosamine 2-epimerase family)